MEYRTIQVKDLTSLSQSEAFEAWQDIPISPLRAFSHGLNPRAKEEDTALILVVENDELLGYMGLLPDLVLNAAGNLEKCSWLSCLWVSPKARGKGIAKTLLSKAHQAAKQKLLLTEFTPAAEAMYQKTGFIEALYQSPGIRLYLGFAFEQALQNKGGVFTKLSTLWKALDKALNLPLQYLAPVLSGSLFGANNPTYEPCTVEDLPDFSKTGLSRRCKAEWAWVQQHPWLSTESPKARIADRYHFSVYAQDFDQGWYKTEEGESFFLLSVRNGDVKVPYFSGDEQAAKATVRFLIGLAYRKGWKRITLYHPPLRDHLDAFGGFYLFKVKPIWRKYMKSKELEVSHESQFQDGDGDCAFT